HARHGRAALGRRPRRGDLFHALDADRLLASALERLENTGGQHHAARGVLYHARELLDERIGVCTARDEDEPGLRAELTDPESERAEEPLRDRAAPLLQCAAQYEHR